MYADTKTPSTTSEGLCVWGWYRPRRETVEMDKAVGRMMREREGAAESLAFDVEGS